MRHFGGGIFEEVVWCTERLKPKCLEAVSVCCDNAWVWNPGVCRLVCDKIERSGRHEPHFSSPIQCGGDGTECVGGWCGDAVGYEFLQCFVRGWEERSLPFTDTATGGVG